MNYRHIVKLCLLIQVLGSSSSQKSQGSGWCDKDKNVCNQDSFCHRQSKMCVCKNGNSHYPMCEEMKDCEPNCDQMKTWCTATPKCCNVNCGRFESCMDGRCECKYGENSSGRCIRCMHRCRRGEVCKRRHGEYQCVRKHKKHKKQINCVPLCGEGSKCKRINGIVKCTACGPGKELRDEYCSEAFKWSEWVSWSSCSITCGKDGTKTRRRTCSSAGRCTGKEEETMDCSAPPPNDECEGTWGAWGGYGNCNKPCNHGTQTRTRICPSPGPACVGENIERIPCNTHQCPTPPPPTPPPPMPMMPMRRRLFFFGGGGGGD